MFELIHQFLTHIIVMNLSKQVWQKFHLFPSLFLSLTCTLIGRSRRSWWYRVPSSSWTHPSRCVPDSGDHRCQEYPGAPRRPVRPPVPPRPASFAAKSEDPADLVDAGRWGSRNSSDPGWWYSRKPSCKNPGQFLAGCPGNERRRRDQRELAFCPGRKRSFF